MRSRTVIVLSGPIAAGKTTLATELSRSHAAAHVSSSGLLSAQAGRELSRGELQRLGREDPFQDGDWLVTAVRQQMAASAVPELVVVDAARTVAQVRALRLALWASGARSTFI